MYFYITIIFQNGPKSDAYIAWVDGDVVTVSDR